MVLRLRRERIDRDWSLSELSRRTGIERSNLSRLEKGQVIAYPGWRRRLAMAFKLPADELFREVEDETTPA